MAPLKLKKLFWLLAGVITGVLLANWSRLMLAARRVAVALGDSGAEVVRRRVDFVADAAYDWQLRDFKYFTGKELQDDFRFVSEADFLRDSVRVLCFSVLPASSSDRRAAAASSLEAIVGTWGPQCNAVAVYATETFGHARGVPLVAGRNDTSGDVLRHLLGAFGDNHTWFAFVPPKTYLMAENLRRALATEDRSKPLVITGGSAERSPLSFFGAGVQTSPIVFSKAALSAVAEATSSSTSATKIVGCLQKEVPDGFMCAASSVGATFMELYDQDGCSLHLPLPPGVFHYARQNSVVWKDEITKSTCCPQFPISFSTVDVSKLYDLHWFTHHLKVYGRRNTIGGRVRIMA